MDFFNEKSSPDGLICGFCVVSFKSFIDEILEYSDLIKFIAGRLLTSFTLVLYRIYGFLLNNVVQCSYSQGTLNLTEHLFVLEQAVQLFKKIIFRNNRKKFPRKTNGVTPNLSNISRKIRLR